MHAKSIWLCLILRDAMDYSLSGSSVNDSIDKNTEMGCHALLQGIFQTQGSNPRPYVSYIGRRVLYH